VQSSAGLRPQEAGRSPADPRARPSADRDRAAENAAENLWSYHLSFTGKKYMGVERSTVVVDADGTVKNVFRRVKPAEHAAQVLDALGSS
jgi:peroxiredoxin